MLTINFILVFILIVATAFFVATEFAIVRVRPSRVDQLVLEGKKNALAVQKVTSNLDGYLAACQLGITITAMGLGWLGEPTIERLLQPLFIDLNLPQAVASLISFLLAFLIMTYLHVVFGELAPKTIAIQKAEQLSLFLAKPIIFFYKISYPLIWLLNGSALRFVRLFGIQPANEHEEAHSEEELRLIITDSYKSGNINQAEYGYVSNIFNVDELLAREIMVPRTDMVTLDINLPMEENLKTMMSERYTRFPVIDKDKDHIIGILNTKQYFMAAAKNPDVDISSLLLPVLAVPEVIPVTQLLKRMQKSHMHLAILLDEYGGTSGMLTIEDILEEIVGEIRDEFDQEEQSDIEKLGKYHVIVDGKVPISVVNELVNAEIESEDIDTIGGWLYNQHSALKKGSVWEYEGLVFTVLEKENHRIRKIEIVNTAAEDSETEEDREDGVDAEDDDS